MADTRIVIVSEEGQGPQPRVVAAQPPGGGAGDIIQQEGARILPALVGALATKFTGSATIGTLATVFAGRALEPNIPAGTQANRAEQLVTQRVEAEKTNETNALRLQRLTKDSLARRVQALQALEAGAGTGTAGGRVAGLAAAGGRATAAGAAGAAGTAGAGAAGGAAAGGALAAAGPIALVALAAVEVVGAFVSAVKSADRAILQMADDAKDFSGAVASAEAIREMRLLQSQMFRAEKLGDTLGRFVEARTDFEIEMEEIKTLLAEQLLPIAVDILRRWTEMIRFLKGKDAEEDERALIARFNAFVGPQAAAAGAASTFGTGADNNAPIGIGGILALGPGAQGLAVSALFHAMRNLSE